MSQTALITGASGGLGLNLQKYFQEKAMICLS